MALHPCADTYSHKAGRDIPQFCGTQRFIHYTTKAHHWILSPFPRNSHLMPFNVLWNLPPATRLRPEQQHSRGLFSLVWSF